MCYVEFILVYGCGPWAIIKLMLKKIEPVDMCLWRSMLRLPRIATKTKKNKDRNNGRSWTNKVVGQ